MKQVLMTNARAIIARVPRVTVESGSLLVQTHFSLISTGTELASLKSVLAQQDSGALGKAAELSSRAAFYLGKAINNPTKAAQRLKQIAASRVRRFTDSVRRPATPAATAEVSDIGWRNVGAAEFAAEGPRLRFKSNESAAGYQVMGRRIALSELRTTDRHHSANETANQVTQGAALIISIKGRVTTPYTLGILDGAQRAWVAQVTLDPGAVAETLQFDTSSADAVHLVLANCGVGEGVAEFSEFSVRLTETEDGLPASETNQIGWNVGYSSAGEVIAVGAGVSGYRIGDFVACAGAGQANHAEFISVKQNLCAHVPTGTPLHRAATTTVGSIAMQGLRRTEPRLGEVVCIVGLGLIGMISVQLFRTAGCKVIGLDLDPSRVDRALKLGANAAVIDADECQRLCLHMTDGHGADATVVTAASKSDALINLAMRTTRRRGRVVIVGDIGMNIERPEFYRKEIDVLMSTSYGPGRYDPTYELDGRDYPYAYVRWTQNRNMTAYLELVATGAIDVDALIDEIVPVDRAPETYDALARSKSPPLGVLLAYSPEPKVDLDEQTIDRRDSTQISIRGARKPLNQLVGYCLVGAGGFGTSMLVPQMDKRRDVFQLKGIVSRDPVRGGNFARQRGVELLSTDFDAALADDSIQLVVIATRHHEHAEQVARALEAGKHVFVEKPLALTWSQLDHVRAAYEASDRILMVGFNRGFAPAALAVKKALATRKSPLVISYRLNGGFIAGDSWIQGSQGGGRNLGEACHMYDFFGSFTNSPVTSIAAHGMAPGATAYRANDNFAATLSYEDGSVCNLVYTAAGPKSGLAKERIEVFCEGRAFLIDDFVRCDEYPSETTLWQATTADKGHFNELSALADALRDGTDAPIPVHRIFETTAVALQIEDQLHGRA